MAGPRWEAVFREKQREIRGDGGGRGRRGRLRTVDMAGTPRSPRFFAEAHMCSSLCSVRPAINHCLEPCRPGKASDFLPLMKLSISGLRTLCAHSGGNSSPEDPADNANSREKKKKNLSHTLTISGSVGSIKKRKRKKKRKTTECLIVP